MTDTTLRALRDARGLADRRALEPSLSDRWVYDFYRHQAPGGHGDGPARGGQSGRGRAQDTVERCVCDGVRGRDR